MTPKKYRAWDNKKGEFFKPTFKACEGKLEDLLISLNGHLHLRTLKGMAHESTFPDRFILEEYIGHKDKKRTEEYPEGQEICEGDKIKFTANYTTAERCGNHEGVIVWCNDEASFKIKVEGFDRPFSIWDETNELKSSAEVIGNIHQDKAPMEK